MMSLMFCCLLLLSRSFIQLFAGIRSGPQPGKRLLHFDIFLVCAVLLVSSVTASGQTRKTSLDRARENWSGFIASRSEDPVPQSGAVICVGSSHLARWKEVSSALDPLKVYNYGIGGTTMKDAAEHFVQNLLVPFQPRAVILYEGSNDIARGAVPQEVMAHFHDFIAQLRHSLPNTHVYVTSVIPSPGKRFEKWNLIREANHLLKLECEKRTWLTYVDAVSGLIGKDGQIRTECFIPNDVHMNAKGYAVWSERIPPVVREGESLNAPALWLYEPAEFKEVPYRLMKPIDYDATKAWPLILSLHGAGGRGNDNQSNLRNWNGLLAQDEMRRRHPAFVLVPHSEHGWTDPNSPLAAIPEITAEMIRSEPPEVQRWLRRWQSRGLGNRPGNLDRVFELIDQKLVKEFNIDTDRVYCLGHSMGGEGTFTAIYLQPERFAAAIPTAGIFLPWRDVTRIRDIPVWTFHGDDDPVVPYAFTERAFERLQAIGGNMKFTTLKGIRHAAAMPALTYRGDPESGGITRRASELVDQTPDVWDWLFQQKRVLPTEEVDR